MSKKEYPYRSKFNATVYILFFMITCKLAISQSLLQSTVNRNTPLIELKGNAYERGLQHGTQLKKEIEEVFHKWKENIRKTINANPDSTLAEFLKGSDFEPITKIYLPDVLEELKGIAVGSNQNYKDVYAFQLVDEFWAYLDKQYNTSNHHCSGLGVQGGKKHPTYIAQNIDMESYMNGYQTLLHISATKNEPEQYIITCAGLLAINGMNSKGIGICVNTLMELKSSSDGLPVAFIIRGILNKQNGYEAISFLHSVKHASGQNYILGVADSIYDYEVSANKVVRFTPKPDNYDVVYHTNHALVNHDTKAWYENYHKKVLAGLTKNKNSELRFLSLENQLNKNPDEISMDIVKSTLRSKQNENNPICRPFKEGSGFTFSSVLFTLGSKLSVQLTNGSPDQSDYKEYFFNK